MGLKICAPDIFEGDAVGNHCLGIVRMGRRLGYEVSVYAQNFEANFENINPIKNLFLDINESDILLVSYSIYDKYLDAFLGLSCKKICYFHGVTSPELLDRFESATAKLCYLAIRQINKFRGFDAVICNSKNTSSTLKNIVEQSKLLVIPPVFSDMPIYKNKNNDVRPNENLNFLMVGRCVPHKNIELAIEILVEVIHQFKKASLTIVGSTPNLEYLKFIINKARKIGVLNSIDFTGAIHDQGLAGLYRSTTGLLVTSRHEGFGVPVLEALKYGKPVFLLGGTAAQELDIEGNVFTEIDMPVEWASKIKKCLRRNKSLQEADQKRRIKYAMEILNLTDDAYWDIALNSL